MRQLPFLLLILLTTLAHAQSDDYFTALQRSLREATDLAAGKPLAQVSRPDLMMLVKTQRATGADLVTITAIRPNYPTELLKEQILKLSQALAVEPRGMAVGVYTVGEQNFTRGTFGTNGLVDQASGQIRLSPILQSFVGVPKPNTVQGMIIIFEGMPPSERTLRTYSSAGVRLEAVSSADPPQVEYRVQFLSQDPEMVKVPDLAPEQKPSAKASTQQQNGVDWTMWVALIVAAGAAGVIVYYLMLRAAPKTGR